MKALQFFFLTSLLFCFMLSINNAQTKTFKQKKHDYRSHKKNSELIKNDSSRRINSGKSSQWKKTKASKKTTLYKRTGIDAIPSAERVALIALYNSTDGDNWTNNSGWKDDVLEADGFGPIGSENTWVGISINADHVEDIVLTSNNLTGTLPPELGDLPNLVTLYLSENNLTGSIPIEIGGLANLEEIALNTNSMSGPIPTGIADAGDLPALWGLDIGNNNFNGAIPPELGNLAALVYLYMDHNDLTGSVPEELGNLANLTELDIYSNELDGIIEPGFSDLGNLPNLDYLDLGVNHLTGTIPATIGNLGALVELYLDGNELTGNIPAGMGDLGSLENLDLSYNHLDGMIEAGIADAGDLPLLEYFIIEYNYLTGSIPAGIGNLSSLRFFIADNNLLNGSIPPGIGNLNNLLMLYLYNNQLTGSIPSEMGGMSSLIELDLWDNQLSGNIPAGMFDPGELPNLVYLDLSTNQLTGEIPSAIANLGDLELFAAVENQLDVLPQELGDLDNLYAVYLFDNKFSAIPPGMLEAVDFPNLEVLDLCMNEFSGTIPTEFENLPSLEELYLSGNKFSGTVPIELMNIANLIDDGLDIRWNSVYTSNAALRTFLDSKQDGGDWESTQTIAPTNARPAGRLNSVSYIQWDPIQYTDDPGGYDIYYSAVSGGPYVFTGSANGKTTSSYGCTGYAEHSSGYFVVKARTNAHSENNNIITSEYSNETFLSDMNYSSYPEVVINTGFTINEGEEITFSDIVLKSRDEDAQTYTLLYTIISKPEHGNLSVSGVLYKGDEITFTQNDIANGKVKYIHSGDNDSTDSFKFTVSDSEGHSTEEQIFEIEIDQINNAPVISDIPDIVMKEDEAYTLDINDWLQYVSDEDSPDSTLLCSVSCNNDSVTVTLLSVNEYLIESAPNYFGTSCLTYSVCDGNATICKEVNLIVEQVNDLPVITGLPGSLSFMNGEIGNLELNGMATDVETPDSLLSWSFSVSPDSVNISFNEETGIVSISANGSFVGTAELTVTVTDADGGSTSQIITITVTPDPTNINSTNGLPTDHVLSQNYPNPFNPSTVIRYGIPDVETRHAVSVQLRIYDILGNLVATLQDSPQAPGYYERTWTARNVTSGIYIYVLKSGAFIKSRKMILLK